MLFPTSVNEDAAWLIAHPQQAAQNGLREIFLRYHALPRHPSQLYEIALEGIVLFIVMWLYTGKPRPSGAASGLFVTGYGIARFIVEFAREPDDFLGLLAFNLSMGQWLSLPMILVGLAVMAWAYSRERRT
jgi:phosphatidylglycerol:prolipoprotein diacylglycerol transferase